MVLNKPHIRKSSIWTFMWKCRSADGSVGLGETPAAAYTAWLVEFNWSSGRFANGYPR